MRFVPIKSVEQQIDRSLERARELLVKQRTQPMNATRSLLAELGVSPAPGCAVSRNLPTRSMLGMP